MKLHNLVLLGLLALGGTATALSLPGLAPSQGEPHDPTGELATELKARTWFNTIGQPPTLSSLKGKVWVVERWATW
ncbi:MAG: hypothetical protein R3F17_16870 [Planctomycetota bacterium]